uniref:MARVEL domain-containing protein n=1 Tax=Bursaphelenchus xylophilus TaxID=6326 RepID=A0A1I7S6N6_BURXY
MIASSSPPPEENVDLDRSSRPASIKSNSSRPASRKDSSPASPERAPSEKTVELIERRPEVPSVQPVVGAEKKVESSKQGTKKATVQSKPSSKVSPLTTMQKKLNFIPKNQRGSLNTQFFATVPGVLKIAEVVLGFVAFVLAICADRNSTSSAWTEHITFESTIIAGVLLLGYIIFPHLTIDDEKNNNGLVVMELIFYAVNTVAYFISVWLMVHLSASWRADGRGAAIMGAILNVALTVLFGIETFIKYKTWKGEQVLQKPADKNHYPTNTSLSPDPEIV